MKQFEFSLNNFCLSRRSDCEMELILFVTIGLSCFGFSDQVVTEGVGATHESIKYVMYNTGTFLTFNEARQVCKLEGGDLAKIDSAQLMDDIETEVKQNNNYPQFFLDDYYVGIIRTESNKYTWVADCSDVTYISHYNKGSFDEAVQCFRHQKDSHQSEPVQCNTPQAFMCQVPTRPQVAIRTTLPSYVNNANQNPEHSCVVPPDSTTSTNTTQPPMPPPCPTINVTVTPSSVYIYVTPTATVTQSVTVTQNPNTVDSTITDTPPINETDSTTGTGPLICPNVTAPIPVTNTLTVTESVTVQPTFSQITVTHTQSPPATMATVTALSSVITDEELESRVQEIVKELTVDVKTTSSYQRKLVSVPDSRKSSLFISFTCAAMVFVPFTILVITDVRRIICDLFKVPANGSLNYKA